MAEKGKLCDLELATKTRELPDGVSTVLRQNWEAGLRSVKTTAQKLQIKSLASKLNIEEKRVKTFIHNTNRDERNKVAPRQPVQKLTKRKLIGFNVFSRGIMRNKAYGKPKQRVGYAGPLWSKLTPDEKAAYNMEANLEQQQRPTRVEDLSPSAQKSFIRETVKTMKSLCHELEKIRVQTAVMYVGVECCDVWPGGSASGLAFLDSDIGIQAENHFMKLCTDSDTTSDKDEDNLRRMVQEIFNEKYSEGIHKPGSRVPYQHVFLHHDFITIHGLPDNVTFKKPSGYRKEQMQAIIAAKDDITMIVNVDKLPDRRKKTEQELPASARQPTRALTPLPTLTPSQQISPPPSLSVCQPLQLIQSPAQTINISSPPVSMIPQFLKPHQNSALQPSTISLLDLQSLLLQATSQTYASSDDHSLHHTPSLNSTHITSQSPAPLIFQSLTTVKPQTQNTSVMFKPATKASATSQHPKITREQLSAMTLVQLQEQCRHLGIASTAKNKHKFVERLLAFYNN